MSDSDLPNPTRFPHLQRIRRSDKPLVDALASQPVAKVTDEMVERAWDAYWDAGTLGSASGSKRAMRAALEAACGAPSQPEGQDAELRAAVERIVRIARAGDWVGPGIPDPVAAAIAYANLVLSRGT